MIATGAGELKPTEYLYGQDPRVLTHLELDGLLMANDPGLSQAKNFAFIQCVGSREPERPYCSKVCCTHSVMSALEIKKLQPRGRSLYPVSGHADLRPQGGPVQRGPVPGRHFYPLSTGKTSPRCGMNGSQVQITVFDPILQLKRDLSR